MSQSNHTSSALLILPSSESYITGFDPLTFRIYGLTVLERTIKALEKGGVSSVELISNRPESELRNWVNAKNWQKSIEVRQTDNPKIEANRIGYDCLSLSDCEVLFILSEPCVFDHAVLNWLRQQTKQPVQLESGLISFYPKSSISKSGPLEIPINCKTNDLLIQTVKSKEDKLHVKKLLRQSLIKSTDGWVSKHLNRPVSISISRMLAHTPITPNQFTIFTGLLGVLAAYLLAKGPYWGFMIGAFLFHFTSILDGVDGELARLKFKASPFGQWLDTLVDNSSYVLALIGYLIGLYSDGITSFEKWAGISTLVFTALALGSMYYYLKRFKKGGSLLNIDYSYKHGSRWSDKLLRALAPLGKRDLFALIFFFLGLIGQLHLALVFISVLTAILFGLSIQAHHDTAAALRKNEG